MKGNDLDRRLSSWMHLAAAVPQPADLLDGVFDVTRRTRQAGRVRERTSVVVLRASRPVRLLAVAALLVSGVGGVLLATAQPPGPPRPELLAVGGGDTAAGGQILLVDRHGGVRPFLPGGPAANCPAFSPDGSRLAFLTPAEGSTEDSPLSEYAVAPLPGLGGPEFVAPGEVFDPTIPPAWSTDGRWLVGRALAAPDGQNMIPEADLGIVATDGSSRRPLVGHVGGETDPVWSPDGQWIAFLSLTGLHVIRPDGTGLRDLVSLGNGFRPEGLAWSPDSRFLSYAGAPRGSAVNRPWDVFMISVDGGPARNLTNSPGSWDRAPAWSPDGTAVAFAGEDGLGIAEIATGRVRWIPGLDVAQLAWWLDGSVVAVLDAAVGEAGNRGRLLLVPAAGDAAPRVLLEGLAGSRCGGRLAAVSPSGQAR